MKKIIFILLASFSLSINAQEFEKNWNKVIAFEKEGKIKSASEEVEKIYFQAKKKVNEPQIIKTFFYRSKYILELEEDSQKRIISNLKEEINVLSVPSKSILMLVYAECLSGYSGKNKYKLQKRTDLKDDSESDFTLWTNQKFNIEIEKIYDESLKHEKALKSTPLTKYKEILDFEKVEDIQNKTLYDYVIQRNIIYYQLFLNGNFFNLSLEPIAEKAYELSEFKNISFENLENKTLLKLIKIYQKLEKENPKNLRYAFEREKYLNGYIFRDKKRHLAFLNLLQKKTAELEFNQEILLAKALAYNDHADKTKFPESHKISLHILDSIFQNKNRSNTYKNALILHDKILTKSLNVNLEGYNYRNQNSRAFINYKNIDTLKIKIFKVSHDFKNSVENKKNKDSIIIATANNFNVYKTTKSSLPDSQDHYEHTTEILLPNLEIGNYLVLFQSDDKPLSKENLNYALITSTDFLLSYSEDSKQNYYQFLNRKTGFPMENVSLEIDSKKGKTDKNGTVTFKKEILKKDIYQYGSIKLLKDNDTLSLPFTKYMRTNFDNNGENKFNVQANIYTDRAIYRPGQTVYSKVIITKEKNSIRSIVDNINVRIEIKDPNYNTVKKLELKTNEYGSVIFEFQIPLSGKTGEFTIIIDEPENLEKDSLYNTDKKEHPFWDYAYFENSQSIFSVEEYKRPSFEIAFDTIKDNFIANDTIKIKGTATAFSGSKISNAKVAYKVQRATRSYFGEKNYWQPDEDPIANGEAETDTEGNFSINFKALPEDGMTEESLPVFEYTITATVTDINGETQTKNTIANAGYHTLKLQIIVPKEVDLKNKNTIHIDSQNLNNHFVPTEGELKFYFLSDINQKFKKSPFDYPEKKSISDAEFERLFPFEEYKKTDIQTERLVFTKKVNTKSNKEITIDFMSEWKSGNYKIVFEAKDSTRHLITETSNFLLFDSRKNHKSNKLFEYEQINSNPKKDGLVDVKIKSAIPELFIITETYYNSKLFFKKMIALKNGEASVRIPLGKEINNDVVLVMSAIFDNQSFSEKLIIPIQSKVENIETEVISLRNKIEPGANETWSFKLNQISKKIESEVLASMYDSSLDQFKTKDWNVLKTENYYNYPREVEYYGFGQKNIRVKNLNLPLPHFNFSDPNIAINFFGFDFNNYGINKRKYEKEIEKAKVPANAKLVYGIITENGIPLPGASIIVNGTDRNVVSDFDGYYEIPATKGEELVFLFLGLKTKVAKVTSNELNINLEEDEEYKDALETVIIRNYVTKKSVASLSSTIIEYITNKSILKPLQGIASGLTINGSTDVEKEITIRGASSIDGNKNALFIIDGIPVGEEEMKQLSSDDIENITVLKDAKATSIYGGRGANGIIIITTKASLEELSKIQTRKNFNETAFFYPQIKTDKDGKFSFNFTSPEALTKWKLRILAHDKKANSGYFENSIITQKDVMVAPNLPRFLREKDSITITAKISNLTAEAKSGMALLQLIDAVSMQPIDAKMLNSENIKSFQIKEKGNTSVSWKIYVPEGLQGIHYKILAKSGNFSDGEENILPVLTNSMLVTESILVWVRENSTKEYTFENLKNNTSSTLRNQQLTLEYTSNPTWLAIQSLPYLMEYEHECAEQTFARYYANALASEILNSNPKIADVFESWKKSGKPVSKLQQNEELKSVLLAETPWLADALSEDEKKKNLVVLFDLQKMKESQKTILEKLKLKQKTSGGFAWFDGGEESEYVTRHIISGLGHLQHLSKKTTGDFDEITKKGIDYLDQKFLESDKEREKANKTDKKLVWMNLHPYNDLHYLYARSFYAEKYPLNSATLEIIKKYTAIIKENKLRYSLYEKGLASLILNRFGDKESAKSILENLRQTASNNNDWGMYWIENKAGWYWHQAPIETQALLIEAFSEIENDKKSVDAMKVWLLKNKQTKNWPSTKATTEAVYALLMQGTDWISVKDKTTIKLGDEKILTQKISENEKEAGTGYIKLSWKTDEIKKEMATVFINNKSEVPGFGGFYWQYFEDLDQIKSGQESPMMIEKELYLKTYTSAGDQLQRITNEKPLKIGDLVTVRLIISAKEDMEFVHLKDMRASCFEPIDVLSKYKWQDGLGYYQSTKDMATHFFFDKINKEKYVLEYDIRVNNLGDFSNGISTIQSMYAPEFSSHTKGIRVKIKE